jgi:hypothetical protein
MPMPSDRDHFHPLKMFTERQHLGDLPNNTGLLSRRRSDCLAFLLSCGLVNDTSLRMHLIPAAPNTRHFLPGTNSSGEPLKQSFSY